MHVPSRGMSCELRLLRFRATAAHSVADLVIRTGLQAQLNDDPLYNPANPMGSTSRLSPELLKAAFDAVLKAKHLIPEFFVRAPLCWVTPCR